MVQGLTSLEKITHTVCALKRGFVILIFVVLLGVSAGCSHWQARPSRCHPLAGGPGEDCFLPFPSSYYTRPDPSSPTGYRVDLAEAKLPQSLFGTPLDPEPYQERDGFSPASSLLAGFPEPVDPASLPGLATPERSLEPKSSVQVLEFPSGQRVPLFAELDANADPRAEAQALVISPLARLKSQTRYIAVIQGLRNRSGGWVNPLTGFARLLRGDPVPGSRLQGEEPKHREILAFLAEHGVPGDHLQLAWDFTTASDKGTVGRLLSLRDQARDRQEIIAEETASERGPIALTQARELGGDRWSGGRRYEGTFLSPSFLRDGNGGRLRRDEKGKPTWDSDARFPWAMNVPACALRSQNPVPVVIYGHGTFSSASEEMSRDHAREMAERLCVIQIGTDWLGRARSDLPGFLLRILPDWNHFPEITDRLQQAHVNIGVLARWIQKGAFDFLPGLGTPRGEPRIDRRKIYYYGISEGGCQGVTALALNPELKQGAMNVPCGFWSQFFWRSSDFYWVRRALSVTYPGKIELQKLILLSQLLWDSTDPAHFGGHLLRDPLPGNSPKRILYQEGIRDASVPNLSTRAMVRTIGLKLLGPAVERVPGVEIVEDPQDSAYVQFDVNAPEPLGLTNIPPPVSRVHEEIRQLEAAKAQVESFIGPAGKVVNTCSGRPCRFSF